MMGLFGFKFYRIRGQSMSPTFEDGDFALCRVAVCAKSLKAQDIIVLKRKTGQPMIKRIVGGDLETGFEIQGDNIRSAPRIDLGRAFAHEIWGKVVLRIGKNGSGFL